MDFTGKYNKMETYLKQNLEMILIFFLKQISQTLFFIYLSKINLSILFPCMFLTMIIKKASQWMLIICGEIQINTCDLCMTFIFLVNFDRTGRSNGGSSIVLFQGEWGEKKFCLVQIFLLYTLFFGFLFNKIRKVLFFFCFYENDIAVLNCSLLNKYF